MIFKFIQGQVIVHKFFSSLLPLEIYIMISMYIYYSSANVMDISITVAIEILRDVDEKMRAIMYIMLSCLSVIYSRGVVIRGWIGCTYTGAHAQRGPLVIQ